MYHKEFYKYIQDSATLLNIRPRTCTKSSYKQNPKASCHHEPPGHSIKLACWFKHRASQLELLNSALNR